MYCTQIIATSTSERELTLFVLTSFRLSTESMEDGVLEAVYVTDGARFWQAEAVIADVLSRARVLVGQRMAFALQALTDAFPSTHNFTYSMGPDRDDSGTLNIHFLVGEASARLRLPLVRSSDPVGGIRRFLATLLENYRRLRAVSSKLDVQRNSLRATAARARELVRIYVGEPAQRGEAQLLSGITSLLNARKYVTQPSIEEEEVESRSEERTKSGYVTDGAK